MKKIFLWTQLLKDIKVTGAVALSSGFLVKQMLKSVNFSKNQVIVELGAGTGCITEVLAKKINSDSKLIVLEVNDIFCRMLREKFTNDIKYIIND